MNKLLPYNSHHTCSKCGNEGWDDECSRFNTTYINNYCAQTPYESLNIRCNRCGYSYYIHTKDDKQQ